MKRCSSIRLATLLVVLCLVLLGAGGCTYGIKRVDLDHRGETSWKETALTGEPVEDGTAMAESKFAKPRP